MDRGHARDLTRAVRVVFEDVFGAAVDAWWDEIASLLNQKDNDLRTWLNSNLFDYHLKRYSKSRAKPHPLAARNALGGIAFGSMLIA